MLGKNDVTHSLSLLLPMYISINHTFDVWPSKPRILQIAAMKTIRLCFLLW
jgi:hypothetical protein